MKLRGRVPRVAGVLGLAIAVGAVGAVANGHWATNRAAAASSTVARLPKLGSKVFAGRSGIGWGAYRPSEISNGGDPTGIVQAIHWDSWGGPTAVGFGTGWYVGPKSIVADGTPGRTELRASDLGHCTTGGPLAYQHLEVRGPARPGGRLGAWHSWSGAKTLCQFGFTPPGPVSVTLALVSCPTTYGVTLPATGALPASISVRVPSDLADQLTVYSDQRGTMKLVGPKGWQCSASYGADGSGGVKVFPSSEQAPSGLAFSPQSQQAIVGSETSACQGCQEIQACPLFPAAANAYLKDYGMSCPQTRPDEESTYQISSGVIGFEDPTDVAGDGNPSGGPFPANGVMTYYSDAPDGSWLDTCTLPASEHALCTVALNTFVSFYGGR